jgi:hypothetical protein
MRKTGLAKSEMELLGWDIPDDVSDEVSSEKDLLFIFF